MMGKSASPSTPRQSEPEKMDGGSSRLLRGDRARRFHEVLNDHIEGRR
jgi:hypothetical protein